MRVELEGLGAVGVLVAILGNIVERIDGLMQRVSFRLGFAGDNLRRLAGGCGEHVVAANGPKILGQALGDEGFAGACVAFEKEHALRLATKEALDLLDQLCLAAGQRIAGKCIVNTEMLTRVSSVEIDGALHLSRGVLELINPRLIWRWGE
ncbi:hypothetical protein D9M70_454730 [compost metagenome]